MFNDLFERAESTAKRTGEYDAKLSPETRALLDEFVKWLRTDDDKSDATSRSYRTYVSKAMAQPEAKLTSDQRSGIRAFERFLKARHPELLDEQG